MFLLLTVLFMSCRPFHTNNSTPSEQTQKMPKGELAFLLEYNGKKPEDVGFLTNHIVERRLANLMKDSFQVFSSKTKFSSPVVVDRENGLIAVKYFNDVEGKEISAKVVIDALHEVFWVYYYNGDSIVKFTDNPSSTPVNF